MAKVDINKLVKEPHIQDLLAFGLSSEQKAVYTIRDSIANADPNVILEIPSLFGCDWPTLKSAALAHCDLDKEYFPTF